MSTASTPRYLTRQDAGATSLPELLERVLDKGVVIAGDIRIGIADTELLSIKLRLLVASVDTARRMGIDWWENDPMLSAKASQLERENTELRQRLERLEARLLGDGS